APAAEELRFDVPPDDIRTERAEPEPLPLDVEPEELLPVEDAATSASAARDTEAADSTDIADEAAALSGDDRARAEDLSAADALAELSQADDDAPIALDDEIAELPRRGWRPAASEAADDFAPAPPAAREPEPEPLKFAPLEPADLPPPLEDEIPA